MSEVPTYDEMLRDLQRSLAAADAIPTFTMPVDEAIGHDPGHVVTAVVSPDFRLTSLSVISGWRKKIKHPQLLEVALMAAIHDAGRRVIPAQGIPSLPEQLWDRMAGTDRAQAREVIGALSQGEAIALIQAMATPTAAHARRAKEWVVETQQALSGLSVPSYDEVAVQMAPVMQVLTEATEVLERFTATASAKPPDNLEATVWSDNKRVHFDYCGGLPVAIDIDRNWLSEQSGTSLTATFAEVIDRHCEGGSIANAASSGKAVDGRALEDAVRQTFLGDHPQALALFGFNPATTQERGR